MLIIRFIYFNLDFNRYNEIKGNFTVLVLQNKSIKEDVQKYEVLLKEKNKFKRKFILNAYTKNKDDKKIYKYGDVLLLQGKLSAPNTYGNPGEFDYKKYLNSKKIYGTISSYTTKKVGHKNHNIIFNISYIIRDFLNSKIEKYLPKKEGNLLKSMLYGDTKFLDETLSMQFENIGITHLLAVSGSNVASVVLIGGLIIEKLKINKKISKIILCIIVVIFTIISNCELSIVRASIMCIILLVGDILDRKYSIWNSIFTSLYLILLYNPFSIFNVGMQLSFLATCGIVMYYKNIKIIFKKYIDKLNNEKLKKILFNVSEYLSVTLSAFILILPIQLYYFNSFNFIMFISNIVAVFLADIICNIGFIALFLSVIPGLDFISIVSTRFILTLLIKVTEILSVFKFLEIHVKSPNILSIIIYYIMVISLFIWWKTRSKKSLKYMKETRKILIYFIVLTFIYNIFFNNYVLFLNVGQGDCCFIKIYSKNILIDCGSKSNRAGGILESYLKKNGITKIDLAFISHAHDDHFNGLLDLKNIKVKRIIYSREDLLKFLDKDTPKLQVYRGENIWINKKCYFKILSPGYCDVKDKDMKNANSQVIYSKLFKNTFLFMGDATGETEKLLLKDDIENIDLLKVGHHGSNTSSTKEFIEKVNPKYAVICSEKKVYGHPSKETIEILKKQNSKIHITEKDKFLKIKI